MNETTATLLQDILEHIRTEDEVLADLSPAQLIAGAFHCTPVVAEYLEKDKRNQLRTRIRNELRARIRKQLDAKLINALALPVSYED